MKRTLSTLCPSCGAQVMFSSGDSVIAVCPYCASTLLRKDESVENLGKMADLFDDHSPLALGAHGRFDGVGFGLIGRLQYRYADGTWNEWRLLFDDGRTGWLSEDNGRFVLLDDGRPIATDAADANRPATANEIAPAKEIAPRSEIASIGRQAPAFDDLRIDQPFDAGGVPYRVVNRERAEVVAGAGELPFVVGGGYQARVADLRGPKGEFATLDYPEADGEPPRFYRGRAVRLDELALNGLRADFGRAVATEPFQCPSCGAPVQARLADTKSISCGACASVIDLANGIGKRIDFYRQAKPRPLQIPLQSVGRFDGVDWTVVGYQRRGGVQDGEAFAWDEYLLYQPIEGFRFLVHDAGHWTWMSVVQRAIRRAETAFGRGIVQYDGKRFDLYSAYPATVGYVAGEFYWRVKQGDATHNQDFIAPPETLSCEVSDNEISWSHGRYLAADEVTKAFGLKTSLPRPSTLGMIQPAPRSWRAAHLKLALIAIGLLLVLQVGLWFRGGHQVLVRSTPLGLQSQWQSQSWSQSPSQSQSQSQSSASSSGEHDHLIEVTGSRDTNLAIRTDAALSNQAIMVNVEVASRAPIGGAGARSNPAGAAGSSASGAARNLRFESSQEIAFWEGRDSDGYWSEGSRSGRIVFKVPPGPYLVRVSGEVDPAAARSASGSSPSAVYRIEQSSRPTWLPFIIGLLALGVLNGIGIFAAPDPEGERWAESQFGTRPGRPASS